MALGKTCRAGRGPGSLRTVSIITTELLLGLPGENIHTLRRAIDESLQLPTTVVGYTLGLQVFPHAPLGIRLAAESAGRNVIRGLQSNTATHPILLKTLEQCESMTEYERQFWFDEHSRIRPVFYFSPDLPEDPETIAPGRQVGQHAPVDPVIGRELPAQQTPQARCPR